MCGPVPLLPLLAGPLGSGLGIGATAVAAKTGLQKVGAALKPDINVPKPPGQETADPNAARMKERERRRQASGQAETILTGARGAAPSGSGPKTLLGS